MAKPTTPSSSAPSRAPFVPPTVESLTDTGLPFLWLLDLALRIFYFRGYLTGNQLAEAMRLPFVGVVEDIVEHLKKEKLLEVKTARHRIGVSGFVYALTGAGIDRAREALERSQYAGPAPVPFHMYNQAMRLQARHRAAVTERDMRQALRHLVLKDEVFHRIGPAVNSGQSIFLYGPPGNGKTTISQAIGNYLLRDTIYIPYSLYIDGQVVVLFDPLHHKKVQKKNKSNGRGQTGLLSANKPDERWAHVHRPFIMVGGELTLQDLDLIFDPVNKYYQAPVQVKANGGMLLVDDFGRQQVPPKDLLNRWIVPLESRVDYLTLHTGHKIMVPFDVLVVFSTNLPPRDLVDEAFLRRLRHKIHISDPGFDEFREIFRRVAKAKGVAYEDRGLAYLLQEWYVKRNRPLRATHPRDLCNHIVDIARYRGVDPALTPELIDAAARVYFVDV